MPAITGTVLMNVGKQLLKNLTKKAVKGTAKKAVKSVVKRKKVKGKDVAKKMLGGGEDKGGALVKSSGGSSIVPSRGGALSKSSLSPAGDDVSVKSSKVANDLGLNSFMDSVSGLQTNVSEIKNALKDNKKSAEDRLEDQRLLTGKIKKEDRESELEAKKSTKKGGPLDAAKKVADGFLARMAKFATMTLLGSLIAALMGGAKDVILAFRIGIEAYKKGMPTLLKGVKALKSGVDDAFKLALKPFKALGRGILEGFQTIGSKLFGWVSKSIGNITQGIKNFGKNFVKTGSKFLKPVTNFVGNVATKGKNLIKNVAGKAKGFVKNVAGKAGNFIKGAGSKIKSFLPGGGKTGSKILKHGLKRGANRLIVKWFGKGAAKTIASVGKVLMKGAKAIKIPVVGPLLVAITSMFAGNPLDQVLFKTMGAAIGGGLGLFLGPIGMFVGEIIGEFIGDVLYEGFRGKDGWAGAGKKLKAKFMQIVNGGKAALNWIGGGFSRFFKGFIEEHSIPIPKGKGVQTVLGKILPFLANKKGLVTSIPNLLQLYNPFARGPLLLKSFFPPGDKKSDTTETTAEIGGNGSNTDAKDVSESASYEDGAEEDTTVVVDGGDGDQAAAPASSGGGIQLIPLSVDKLTLVNSQYELASNAALYKV